jgi:glycosyltransferase involved in cell wall biosynthesis
VRISVAMCTYNGASFLEPQLESIRRQERPPDELIISDDRSTDGTVALLHAFAETAPFPVRISVTEGHLGSTRNYERAIERCEGDVIVLCDQDDVWLPHKLLVMEETFSRRTTLGLAFSDAYLIDSTGRRSGDRLWDISGFTRAQRKRMRRDPFGQVMSRSIVSGCTLAFRTEHRPRLIPFPPEQAARRMRLIHDRWISIMVAATSEVALIDEPLVEYRIHPRQQVGIPRLQVRKVVPQSVLRFRQVAVSHPLMRERLDATIEHLRTVLARLRSGDPASLDRRAIRRVEDCIAHVRGRGALPARRIFRVGGVLRELFSGRYHRYSLGIASAVADLARSPRDREGVSPPDGRAGGPPAGR